MGLIKKEDLWTNEEIRWIKDNYKNLGAKKCSEFLGRTVSACKNKALRLKIAGTLKKHPKLQPGDRFNKLVLIKSKIMIRENYNGIFWECQCDCGGSKTVYQQDLRCNKVSTCGCSDHGLTGTNLYKLWVGIKRRCYNKNASDYSRYGGRGIKLCKTWENDPLAFISYIQSTIGDRPKNKTLDRIDNSKGYMPDNLRWASKSEQARNSSTAKVNESIVKEIKDKYKSGVTQVNIADEYNISKTQVWRIINGQSWGDIKC